MELRVAMHAVTKSFGAVVANSNVNFDLRRGEIHGLLGENGAGKTTLMRILYGLLQPDHGEIWMDGAPVKIDSPGQAIQMGIGMIHQHFMLVPEFTIAENIVTGLKGGNPLYLDMERMEKEIVTLSNRYGLPLDPKRKVCELSVGQQQRVEIIKTLYRGCNVLIMDEPTAVLLPQEVDELFEVLRSFVENGSSVILISHKLQELMKITDRITIMRNGKVIDTVNTPEVDRNELARLMVGREVLLQYKKEPANLHGTALRLQNVSYRSREGVEVLKKVSMDVGAGEIVGVAGVDGNGQTELAEAIAGIIEHVDGQIFLGDRDITKLDPRQRYLERLAYVPENRHTTGLILKLPITTNLVFKSYRDKPFFSKWRLRHKVIREYTKELAQAYHIKLNSVTDPVSSLSGGNQQKVVLARELASNPKMLVIAQPTRGLDIGAIEFVHTTLLKERQKGLGILLISSELEEVLELSDRVVVIYEGELVGEFIPGTVSLKEVGLMMSGACRQTEVAAPDSQNVSRNQ